MARNIGRMQPRPLPTFPIEKAGFYGREQKQKIWPYTNLRELKPIETILRHLAKDKNSPLRQVLTEKGSRRDKKILNALTREGLEITSIDDLVIVQNKRKFSIYQYQDQETGLIVTEIVFHLKPEEVKGVDGIASLVQHNLVIAILSPQQLDELTQETDAHIHFYEEYFNDRPARDGRERYYPQAATRTKLGETQLRLGLTR